VLNAAPFPGGWSSEAERLAEERALAEEMAHGSATEQALRVSGGLTPVQPVADAVHDHLRDVWFQTQPVDSAVKTEWGRFYGLVDFDSAMAHVKRSLMSFISKELGACAWIEVIDDVYDTDRLERVFARIMDNHAVGDQICFS
jgi:hypothetical protein